MGQRNERIAKNLMALTERQVGDAGSETDISRLYKEARSKKNFRWALILLTSGYAWSIYGFLAAFGVLALILAGLMITNLVILATSGNSRLLSLSTWGWPILTLIGLAVGAAKVCSVGQPC